MKEFLNETFRPGPMFGWLSVLFLALIPLVWIRARSRKHRAPLRFSSLELFAGIGTSWASRLWFVIPLLRTLAMIALVIALARPQAGGSYKDLREGIAIQMVLDISGSMAEADFMMNNRPVRRLDVVKAVFEDFVLGEGSVGGRENDLVGMTTFAMFADTTAPLTLDHASLIELLHETDIPGWVNGQQLRPTEEAGFTCIGDGIALATDDLRRAGEQALVGVPGAEPAKSRVMILLTDGKNNPPKVSPGMPQSPDPLEAAKVAATLGIKIYTIGAVGGGGTPRRNSLFDFRATQEVDEPMMKAIAVATGGQYFRAADTDSLKRIYETINQLERQKTGEREYRDDVRAATVAMVAALGLLLTEMFLTHTRFRRIP
ncbi:MAG: VWA domain-containing protein [Planctomycetota bacterium]